MHKYINEVDLLKFFEAQRIRPGFTIAVIGINDGLTSGGGDLYEEPIFEFLNKNVQISAILIEPVKVVFEKLKKNYQSHQNDLTFLNCAVGGKFSYEKIIIQGDNGTTSTLHHGHLSPSEISKRVTQDIFVFPFFVCAELSNKSVIEFIKIDAEGFDKVILHSILDNYEKSGSPKFIQWEDNSPDDTNYLDHPKLENFKIYFSGGINKFHQKPFGRDKIAIHRNFDLSNIAVDIETIAI